MTTPITSQSATITTNQPRLMNFGGRIIEDPRFVSLYAGQYWSTPQGKADRKHLNYCSKTVPQGPHSTVWEEYGVNPGTFLGSASVSLPKNKRQISERDVQNLVAQSLKQSRVAQPDGNTVYTLFLPPGLVLTHGESSSREGLGGYHGSYVDPSTKKPVYYSAIVYTDKHNGVQFTDKPLDNITIAATHEWSEAVTDPDVNRGKLGWYDERYGEIGDIPITMGYPLESLWGRMKGCAVQKEWSNSEQAPVLEIK